jgi:hypothetical protein
VILTAVSEPNAGYKPSSNCTFNSLRLHNRVELHIDTLRSHPRLPDAWRRVGLPP